jgi:ankyrin repeat protein
LRCSIFGKSLATARLLINNGATVNEGKYSADGNLLQCAVRCNAVIFLELFIEQGANVNELSSNGTNAIHLAADLGYAKCLEILLKASTANPNKKTRLIRTDKKSTDRTALHYAAEEGSSECVQLLLKHKADVDAQDFRNRTPLHFAAKVSCVDCVRILLKEGNANINAEDNDLRTPLHVAIRKSESNIAVVKVLLNSGADINAQDRFGITAIHLAALNGLSDCVEFLMKSGANITIKSKQGITALNVISRKTPASLRVVSRMLDTGISMSQTASNEVEITLNFKEIVKHSLPYEATYLMTFVDESKKDILEHPLCKAFLHLKWNKVKILYSLKLLSNFIKILLFSLFVLSTFAEDCTHNHHRNEIDKQSENCIMYLKLKNDSESVIKQLKGDSYWYCTETQYLPDFDYGNSTPLLNHPNITACPPHDDLWICKKDSTTGRILKGYTNFIDYKIQICVLTLIITIEIITKCLSFRVMRRYIFETENVFETLEIILFSVTFSLEVIHKMEWADEEFIWQFHFGAFAIIICWFNFLFLLGQLPSFGSSVDMFNRILKEFLKLFSIFICVFVGFAIGFLIIFPKSEFFANPFIGFISILVFMVGELQTDLITDVDSEDYRLVLTSQIMFLLFMFLVTIVLMNLLIGIAVNDIHQLKKTAVRSKHVRQIKLIYQLEKAMLRDWMPSVFKNCILYSPNRYAYSLTVRPLNLSEKRLPQDILRAIYEIAKVESASENDINDDEFDNSKEEEIPVNLKDVMREIQELKNLILELQNKQ